MTSATLKFSLFLALGVLFGGPAPASAADSLNALTPAEMTEGWKLLFDGHSTAGWRNYGKNEISEGWKVKDGALVRTAKGAGDIITQEQFGDFELSLEYRISKGGNSGIMFGVQEIGGEPWNTGPEIQVQDNQGGTDPQKAGWLYQLYRSETDATKPAGEWNQVRLILRNEGRSEVWMNGVKYYEFENGSPDWRARVAKSKFAKLPKFGQATQGHICLQDHGNEVAYRKIKLRPL